MTEIREARYEDCAHLAKHMREPDRLEINYLIGRSPLETLQRAFEATGEKKLYSIESDDRVLAMFGVNTIGKVARDFVGSPWMLSTDELMENNWRQFVRESPAWIEELGRDYTLLENLIYAGNEAHLKWIKRAGFSLISYYPELGLHRKPFWRFSKRL